MNKKPELSPDQDRAADPLVNVWVQANAGTGKTSVLIQRLLRILFRSDEKQPSGILCLTYTNAGAGEMRNRILRALREWAVATDEELIKLLDGGALNKPATAADVAHARAVFFWYIDNADALKIKTIHGFCEEILRRFPLEAGISPAWTLISDMNQRVLLQEAFNTLIETSGNDNTGRVSAAFEHIVGRISEYSLGDLMKIISEQYKHFFPVDNIERYREYFINTVKSFLELDKVPNVDVPTVELQKILLELDDKISSTKKPAGYLTDLFKLIKQYIDNTVSFDEYKLGYLNKDGAPNVPISKIDFLVAEQERVYKIDQYAKNKKVFDDTLALFDLSAAFTTIYRDIKHQRNLLDFDDLVLYTKKLFSKPDIMGWVLSQLDLSLSHILVDEAQDTPPEQWDILQMLISDFFVGGDTGNLPNTLFVVGDTKQAIYGFQGADFQAFMTSHDDIIRQIKNNLRTISEIPLLQSFRSLSSILYVVDGFFGNEQVARETGFHNNSHKCFRTDDGQGLVEIHKLVAAQASDNVSLATYIDDIVTKVQEVLSSGKYKPCDIMILVQQRDPLVAPLVSTLKRKGVPVAGADRIVLPNFAPIRDLMNLVRFCLNTADDYSLCCVLKSPIFRLNEADIFNLCDIRNNENKGKEEAEKITVFDVLRDARPDIYERLKIMVKKSETFAPYSFFSDVLNSGVRSEFISALGDQVIDPLEEFMTICLAYERTQPGTLRHFLKWFITGGSQVKRNMNAVSGVRIATVHGSKGLEAPVVFLIDTTQIPDPEKILPIVPEIMPANVPVNATLPTPWLWTVSTKASKKCVLALDELMKWRMEEYYRLLYVAMTRARNELYIYGYIPNKNPKEQSWHSMLWRVLAGLDGAVADDEKIRVIHG